MYFNLIRTIENLSARAKKEKITEAIERYLVTKDAVSFKKRLVKFSEHGKNQLIFLRFPITFNKERLRKDLELVLREGWYEHKTSWTVVNLRMPYGTKKAYEGIADSSTCEDVEVLKRCPEFQAAIRFFKCPVYRARLSRLAAKSFITPHVDWFGEEKIRFHIPIITDEKVYFLINNQRLKMNEGELWYVDISYLHSVLNQSSIDRVHLIIIIDVAWNAWLRENLFGGEDSIKNLDYRNNANLRALNYYIDFLPEEKAYEKICDGFAKRIFYQ